MNNKKALLVAYGGGHLNVLLPIAKLLEKSSIEHILFAPTLAGAMARSANVPYKAYRDYKHLVNWQKAEVLGQNLISKNMNLDPRISKDESIAYMGINYLENVGRYGEEFSSRLYQKAQRHSFLPIDFMKKLIESEEIDIVVATNSPKSERAALIAAQELGIPSIRIEDLFIETNLHQMIFNRIGKLDYGRSIGQFTLSPNQVCVMCEYAKELFVTNGPMMGIDVPQSRVIVTGQPIFDELDRKMQIPATRKLFSQQPGRKVVVWAHQNGTLDENQVIDMLSSWSAAVDERVDFVIKVHPNFSTDEVKKLVSRFAQRANIHVITSQIETNHLIWNSDLVVAQESTVLIQACYMRKPVVILDPINIRIGNPYTSSGVGLDARDGRELASAVDFWLSGSDLATERFATGIKKLGIKTNASKNVLSQIELLLREKENRRSYVDGIESGLQ